MPRPLFVLSFALLVSSFASLTSSDELTVYSHPSSVVLPVGDLTEGSPGSRAGSKLACNRIHIHGYSRLRHLSNYAHALKIRLSVSQGDALFRVQTIELCFHRNASIGIGMCQASQWQKLSKNSWIHSVSPYEHRILDIRMPVDPSRTIELSTSKEFSLHRVIFLIIGVIMMLMARALSESVVFYYGSGMTIGIVIVVLIILFQGMKMLPTGGRGSLAIIMYSSLVGVVTFLLTYLSGFVRSILVEIGISEDMHNPLGIFLLVCILLAGAWFGFWGVRKVALTEEGLIDSSVASFVEYSILIFSAAMILQSSLDIILAMASLGISVIILLISRLPKKSKFVRRMSRKVFKTAQTTMDNLSPSRYSYSQYSSILHSPNTETPNYNGTYLKRTSYNSPSLGKRMPLRKTVREETYYSSFHSMPERRKFTKEEWELFTKEETKKAMKELISSPDFNQWALANSDRISVTPASASGRQKKRLFNWF
ncbi:hypothetical protein LUZ60_006530 [Juncus effusus]|nr:hypothetical protein LUZ60_006530 [Juncus effusus]